MKWGNPRAARRFLRGGRLRARGVLSALRGAGGAAHPEALFVLREKP